MGLLGRFRRSAVAPSPDAPVVPVEVLGADDVRWTQPFRWGLLIAHDSQAAWDVPSGAGRGGVAGNASCLAVPVLNARDVQFDDDGDPDARPPRVAVDVVLTTRPLDELPDYDGPFRCPSGRLQVGDADEHRLVEVPPGDLRVQVWLEPEERAERVVIALQRAGG